MTNDADKPDKPTDENENLVKALESIKTLLATSETKLSQARESISKASAHSLKMTTEVPMLDDVVVPGKPLESAEPNSQTTTPTKPAPSPKIDLSAFQTELEKELHSKLSAYAAKLEEELKAKFRDYINKHSN